MQCLKTYEQGYYNAQVQQYYSQLYGQTSPSSTPYPYLGYMPSGQNPRAGSFSPMQQVPRPPFFQQQMTQQNEGSFQSAPSLPPNFRLQLPPRAISRQSDDVSGMSFSVGFSLRPPIFYIYFGFFLLTFLESAALFPIFFYYQL
jgi:hypothetical protein